MLNEKEVYFHQYCGSCVNAKKVPGVDGEFDKIIIHKFENEFVNDVFVADCEERMRDFNQLNPHHSMTLGEHCKFTADLLLGKDYWFYYVLAARLQQQ